MPNLAANHPQVVHFAVALLFVGVAFRLISLTGRIAFTKHAAATLLLLGTVAAVVSVQSGMDAHGPVERIPGVRNAVVEHEDLGKDARNAFLVVVVAELLALGLAAGAKTGGYAKLAYVASALVGLYGTAVLYEAAEHGGALVYQYAGGPGLRRGDPADVERLLVAGLYAQSQADRKAGRGDAAARLVNEMSLRLPGDTTVKFLQVESMLLDAKDLAGALATVRGIRVDDTNARWATRKASITADIFVAMGQPDSARAVLAPVVAAFPNGVRLKAKLDSLR